MPAQLPINQAEPQVMHIDLNSCFAMIEQQANPHLRGKPVAMTNRKSPGATVIAASYEAKKLGIGVGTKMSEAQQADAEVIVLETDPPKYSYAHKVFLQIIRKYSPSAVMKSVDEGVIDFRNTRLVNTESLVAIGQDIKQQLKTALGEWMTCNVGIAPNRWLAKLAASLNKPDGLSVINHRNLLNTYRQLELIDLFGINYRYQARLQAAGIFSPSDFFNASESYLTHRVFHSVGGHQWYLRLRGWEVDQVQFGIKTIGRQYVLHHYSSDVKQLAPIVMKMCEGVGRRMRRKGFCAQGMFIYCWFTNHEPWYARKKFKTSLYTTPELYAKTLWLFGQRPAGATVKGLSITAYGLKPAKTNQLALFETDDVNRWRLTDFIDDLNDRYGEFSVMPGAMANTTHLVPEKIPFGSTRYF